MKKRMMPIGIAPMTAVIIVLIILIGLALLFLGGKNEQNAASNETNYCKNDGDCVPDSCCHSRGCTAKANAPACKGVLCTMSCESGTLDCGQGICKCEKSRCEAVFKAAAEIPNPASVYCVESGGKLEIRTDASGGQQGICVLANGTECDEWKYYHGEC